jgi:hypothetical protein
MSNPTPSRRQRGDPVRALRAIVEEVKCAHGPDAVPASVWAEATESEDLQSDLERWRVADEIRQALPNVQTVLTTTGVRSQPLPRF